MARAKGWRAVKSGLSYTVGEVARNQGVAKGTVLRWLKTGLPYIKDQRPYLILGGDLVTFLKARKPPKQKLALDEFRCFTCKAPRKPAFNMVEYAPKSPKSGMLTALCAVCSTVMNKGASYALLEPLKANLHISFPNGHEPLSKGMTPRSNDHLERE